MKKAHEIDKVLRDIPLDHRVGALILSLCENGGVDCIAAIRGLIATTAVLGQTLDEHDRRCCSMALRDCAVEVESEYRPLVMKE
jgi:hypothetical protein